MPRDPLAWLPLLRHWTQCLGQGPDAIPRMGDQGGLPDLDMAAMLPGGPGWSDVQRRPFWPPAMADKANAALNHP